MENASKALIIAGAILLAILIIGLGMLIFNQAKDAIGNTGLDKQKIEAVNSEFEAYTGDTISGTKVRALLDAVKSYNGANHTGTNDADENNIGITSNINVAGFTNITNVADQVAINGLRAKIKPSNTYKVEITAYNQATGFVQVITISQ